MIKILLLITMMCLATPAFAQDDGIDDEKAVRVFTYLLKDEAEAKTHIKQMREIAPATNFSPLIIVAVSRQLLATGLKQPEIKPFILVCADVAAGVGADEEGFSKIGVTLAELKQTDASVYAVMETLRALGVPSWQVLEKGVGKSVEDLKDLALHRRFDPPSFLDLYLDSLRDYYQGAAEKARQKKKAPPSKP